MSSQFYSCVAYECFVQCMLPTEVIERIIFVPVSCIQLLLGTSFKDGIINGIQSNPLLFSTLLLQAEIPFLLKSDFSPFAMVVLWFISNPILLVNFYQFYDIFLK